MQVSLIVYYDILLYLNMWGNDKFHWTIFLLSCYILLHLLFCFIAINYVLWSAIRGYSSITCFLVPERASQYESYGQSSSNFVESVGGVHSLLLSHWPFNSSLNDTSLKWQIPCNLLYLLLFNSSFKTYPPKIWFFIIWVL